MRTTSRRATLLTAAVLVLGACGGSSAPTTAEPAGDTPTADAPVAAALAGLSFDVHRDPG